jgi:hypothetical protein
VHAEIDRFLSWPCCQLSSHILSFLRRVGRVAFRKNASPVNA